MLKKISVDQLTTGMFLNELCGSWMEHPFWKTRFLLKKPGDVERIRSCGIREVWIDTSQGADVPVGETTEARAEVEQRTEAALITAVTAPDPKPQRVAIDVEVARAAKICAKARTAVVAMFREARMGTAVSLQEAEPLVEEISGSVMRNPGALVSLARLKTKDDYTYMHSVAVCGLMIALARQLGLAGDVVRDLGMAGLLHDLGKARIPDKILNKPGKLTDAEFARVKSHPEEGHRMLVEGGAVGDIPLDVCLHHHEKVDGSGYPHRLSAEAISLYAKMGAICDVYDAITSDRPYKQGWDPGEAIRKMTEWANGHFDMQVFHAFVKCIGIYPIGSLVRLQSDRLAVVVEQHPHALLAPVVKVFYCARSRSPIMPAIVDLAAESARDKIKRWESPTEWGFTNLGATALAV
ncbi:MAG: HD-GYP domain-containing protein [Gammaproteobacteria bacterium]